MILDSNIFIYAVQPEYVDLRNWCSQRNLSASEITRLEVLGYHNLSETDERDLTRLFALTTLHPVSSTVINGAISLRQQRNISVGDAIIAATALLHRQTLVTRNIDDFGWIDGLKVVDPFDGL